MWILGIAGSHNSGAALIRDGRVVVAVQTERLVRIKRQAIRLDRMGADAALGIAYCLSYAGIDMRDLSAIATSTPFRAVKPGFALGETARFAMRSLPSFVTVPHHLAHAEYALHYSPQRNCNVLVCDGSGTYESDRAGLDIKEVESEPVKYLRGAAKESISAYNFDGLELQLIYRVADGPANTEPSNSPASDEYAGIRSLGMLWEWAARYCHGSHNEAGKVMGLAPYGRALSPILTKSAVLGHDGKPSFSFSALMQEFRTPNVDSRDVSGQAHYQDVAAGIQDMTNSFLVDLVSYIGGRYEMSELCYAGGVALNGVSNEHLRRSLDLELHMNGSCEDNGTAIGAALAVFHALTGERVREEASEYLGRRYTSEDIAKVLEGHTGAVVRLPRQELLRRTASALASGAIVGWFQGRSEFGPRALGNRSILADPRDACMQERLNSKVKRREEFRPYAPVVTEERANVYFRLGGSASPHMLRVVPVKVASLPAVTHVDGTARVQTVNRKQNALLYDLLQCFEVEGGVPVLLNTSFNFAGEPIVESPVDALQSLEACGLDVLVMEDHWITAATSTNTDAP